jgi:histidinol dehydrogenase
VRCAGSLFVGGWSAQVAGDYAIGSNHVLPTAGAARVRGGLSAADFVRQITVQRVTRAGLQRIGPSVVDLATAEGLTAHAESVALRLRAK